MSLIWIGAGAFLALNSWVVLRFWQNKQRAVAGERRVAEADLLALALIGGSPGAFLARRWFRHKTRKEPFSTQLLLLAALQTGVLIGLVIAFR